MKYIICTLAAVAFIGGAVLMRDGFLSGFAAFAYVVASVVALWAAFELCED